MTPMMDDDQLKRTYRPVLVISAHSVNLY